MPYPYDDRLPITVRGLLPAPIHDELPGSMVPPEVGDPDPDEEDYPSDGCMTPPEDF